MQRPIIVVTVGFIDEERTMSGLLPVARIASPRRVFRKNARNSPTSSTAAAAIISLYVSANAVSFNASRKAVKTVSVLFILRSEELPITAILTE